MKMISGVGLSVASVLLVGWIGPDGEGVSALAGAINEAQPFHCDWTAPPMRHNYITTVDGRIDADGVPTQVIVKRKESGVVEDDDATPTAEPDLFDGYFRRHQILPWNITGHVSQTVMAGSTFYLLLPGSGISMSPFTAELFIVYPNAGSFQESMRCTFE